MKTEDEVKALEAENADLKEKVADLEKQLKAANAATTKAKKAAVTALPKVTQPRKIGPMKDTAELGFLEEFLKADDAAFTVVASDGKKEVIAIAPRAVSGEVWMRRKAGIVLIEPITVMGPNIGQPAAIVAGFGLLDEKGTQVAWAPLTQEVRIPPQQEMRFKDLAFA